MILSSIQDLVSRAGLPGPDRRCNTLWLAEYGLGLPGSRTLITLRCGLAKEWDESQSRTAKARPLEEGVRAAEDDSEALRVACGLVAELMANRGSFTTMKDQANAEHDTLPAQIFELEVAEEIRDEGLAVAIHGAAGEDRMNTAEAQGFEILEKTSELRVF